MPDLRAHLFFSYAHDDAERLLPFHERMELALGRYIWVDKLIERGTAWENSIKSAITNSYGVIFAVTKTFVTRPFILDKEIPWALNQFQNMQGASLFVILLDDVELPSALKTPFITHLIDARDGDFEGLLTELGKDGLLPQPQASHLPFLVDWNRLPNFKGRDGALLDLHRLLVGQGGKAGIKTVGAFGMGGIGKTQLAVEYAHRYRFYYPAGVYWINAAADWSREVASCAEYLGLKPLDETAPDRDGQLALAFQKHLQEQDGDALLVLDNVADPKDIVTRPIAPRLTIRALSDSTRAKLLFTTRVQSMPDGMTAIEIGVLTSVDARATLLDAWMSERVDTPDLASLDALARAVGYLPLALGWLAAALTKRTTLTPKRLLDLLRERGIDDIAATLKKQNIDLGTPGHYEALVGVALDWQLDQLQHPDSLKLLALIAAYGEAAVVPVARLRLLTGLAPDDFDDPFAVALDELRAYSLTEILVAGLRLHPLTGDYIRKTRNAAAALREQSARLVISYRDPAVLVSEFASRGFPAILEDVRATRAALSLMGEDARMKGLSEVEFLLLRLEPFIMDSPAGIGVAIPAETFLVQQLRALAHDEGDYPLRDACDHWLAGKPRLQIGRGASYPADPALLRTLAGHTDGINGATMLADGRILSWSKDGTLRLWTSGGDLIFVLKGHSGWINWVEVLPDGQILSWSSDQTLRLWTNEGDVVCVFEGHTNTVTGGKLMTDGRILSWGNDGTIRLWTRAGVLLHTFEGHLDWINGLEVLADGRILSWSPDKTLRLWSGEGESLRVLSGHSGGVVGAQEMRDGRILSWSNDGTLRLWSRDGDLLHILEGHTDGVYGAESLNDGRILSWSNDRTLRLWSDQGVLLRKLEGHQNWILSVTHLADGRFLSCSADGVMLLWTKDGDALRTFAGHTNSVRVEVLADGRFLTASSDKTIRLWSEQGDLLSVFEGHSASVRRAVMLADERILSWSSDGTLKLWNSKGGQARDIQEHSDKVNGLQKLADGRTLSWSADGTLRLWSAEGRPEQVLEGHSGEIHGSLLLADGRILSWSNDQTLRLWLASANLVQVLEGHHADVQGALVLPDQHILSWSSGQSFSDNMLCLWTTEGEFLRTFKGHTSGIVGATFLSDGRILSWSEDGTLRLWSGEGDLLYILTEHQSRVNGARVLSDGRILSWSSDRTLRLWTNEGEPIRVLEGHTNAIWDAFALPDGRILSRSWDKTLRLWSSDGQSLRVLEGHTSRVNGALVLPSGNLLSWSSDKMLRLWTREGVALRTLEGHANSVWGALSLPDGRILSWSSDDTMRLWSPDGVPLAVYVNGDEITSCIALGDSHFVFGDARGRVVFFDIPTE